MKHPVILLIPFMMFADYFLTVLGAVEREKKYTEHFRSQHYELNPIWQKTISEKRWFNRKHAILVLLFSFVVICLAEFGGGSPVTIQLISGFVFVFYGMIIGRHISNILIFRSVERRPNDISGTVTMSHSLLLTISAHQYLVAVIPIFILALFEPAPFTAGGGFGALMVLVVHAVWILKHKHRMRSSGEEEEIEDS